MPTHRPMRTTGREAKRENTTNKTIWFKAFLEENRHLIIQKIQQETGSQKIVNKLISSHAKEVWGSMSEQQKLVYAV